MPFLARVLERPALVSLRDAAATVRAAFFFLGPVVALLVVIYAAWLRNWVSPTAVAIVVTAAVAAGLGVAVTLAYGRRFLDPNPYVIVSSELVLVVEREGDHHIYTYTRELSVTSSRDDVRLIQVPWHWTGVTSTPLRVSPLHGDYTVFDGALPEANHRIYRWIYLGRPLDKGETVRVGITFRVTDDRQPMRPFLQDSTLGVRARHLRTVLRFPRQEEPEQVEAIATDDRKKPPRLAAKLDMTRSVNVAAGTVDFAFDVARPKEHLRYSFRWRPD